MKLSDPGPKNELNELLRQQYAQLQIHDKPLPVNLGRFLRQVSEIYNQQQAEIATLREKKRKLLAEVESLKGQSGTPGAPSYGAHQSTESDFPAFVSHAAMASRESTYRHIFENNPLPVWVVDDQSERFLDVNQAAVWHYGYTKEEFLQMKERDILCPNEPVPVTPFLRSQEYGSVEIACHVKKNGEVIIVETSADVIGFAERKARLVLANDVTGKVKAEKKLKESKELFELVTKATSDAIWDWDIRTNHVYWSEGYAELFGYKSGKVPFKQRIGLIHPEDRARIETGVNETLLHRSSDCWEAEYRCFRADGSLAHVHDRGYVLFDDNNCPVRMVGALQDISKRKNTEENLLTSEANLRAILENTDTSYVLLDENAMVLSFNHRALELSNHHFTGTIAVGKNYIGLMRSGRRKDVQEKIGQVLQKGHHISYEVAYEMPDQKTCWMQVKLNPIYSGDKRIIGLSIGSTNITESKLATQLLEQSEANLRTIFNNTEITYILMDTGFRVLSFNWKALRKFKKRFGVTLHEGIVLPDCMPAGQTTLATNLTLALKGKKVNYERSYELPDGDMDWASVSIFPVADKNKTVFGLILASENITQRKKIELEKEKMTLELIRRNKDLEQFAYIISHNLRSPVANITGLSNLLLQPNKFGTEDFTRCLTGLAQSVKKLDEVIIDLNFILQVRKEIHEKKEPVSLQQLVTDISTSIQSLILKEQAEITVDFSETESLHTLKSYLQSIFYNLIINSIHYRHTRRHPVVKIRSLLSGSRVRLIFEDNGRGFDLQANQGKVFGLYKKFHENTDGKGMGLYMVKTQVEMLDGTISVESEVDKGSTFIIEFNA